MNVLSLKTDYLPTVHEVNSYPTSNSKWSHVPHPPKWGHVPPNNKWKNHLAITSNSPLIPEGNRPLVYEPFYNWQRSSRSFYHINLMSRVYHIHPSTTANHTRRIIWGIRFSGCYLLHDGREAPLTWGIISGDLTSIPISVDHLSVKKS